jgi:hypothetical protein
MIRKVFSVLTIAGAVTIAACADRSDDGPVDTGDGRLDAGQPTGSAAVNPDLEVLEGMGVGATPEPGAVPVDTARMRDTAVVDATGRVDGR